jgi:hypothetical protein
LVREPKADRRHVDWSAAFVGNQDGDAARRASPGSISDAFAFHHSQLHDHGGVGGNRERQGAGKQAAPGFYGLV